VCVCARALVCVYVKERERESVCVCVITLYCVYIISGPRNISNLCLLKTRDLQDQHRSKKRKHRKSVSMQIPLRAFEIWITEFPLRCSFIRILSSHLPLTDFYSDIYGVTYTRNASIPAKYPEHLCDSELNLIHLRV